MRQPEDHVLALVLQRVRNVPAETTRACLAAAEGERSFPELIVEKKAIPADEVPAFQEAARYLSAGDCMRACPARECRTQVVAPPAPGAACPRCRKPMIRGLLPAAQALVFDPGLDRQVRRVIQESLARSRTQGRVAEAARLRSEGKIGNRPEAELAPKQKSCTEQTLGPFKLFNLIGRGSSSYVYRAQDSRNGRVVALKVLYFDAGEPPEKVQEKLARFKREAELAGALDHPNLVAVGPLETSGSWTHLAMTFVDGPTLAQLLEAREAGGGQAPGTDLRALAAALADVARGLHYAHCQGVVHRDVNPRNILFSSTGQPSLSDFGIARPIEEQSVLTGERVVLGTLEYVAPERLRSETLAEPRSDVYSLGVVLYQILTGRVPRKADNPMLLLNQIKNTPVPAPRSIQSEVPAELEAVALRALEADPAKRHPSALDFAQALTDAVSDAPSPAAATPAETDVPAPAPVSRGRILAVAALAFAVGIAVMAALPGGAQETSPAALRAALPALERRVMEANSLAAARSARTAYARALDRLEEAGVANRPDLQIHRARLAWAEGRLVDAERGFAAAGDARLAHGLCAFLLLQRNGAESETGRKHLAASLEDFNKIFAAGRETWEGRFAGAMISLLNNDADAAYSIFHTLAREDLARSEAAFMEGWVAFRHGTPGPAVKALEFLATNRPGEPFAQTTYALALAADGQEDAALKQARIAREAWPDLPEAAMAEGIALLRKGDDRGAAAALERAHALAPESLEVHRLRAHTYAALDSACESAAAWSRVIALAEQAEDAWFERARMRLRHGDADGGKADLQEYVHRFPEGPHASEAADLLKGR